MVWWIVAGELLVALVILAAAVVSVVGRLPPLRLAQRRLNRRLEQARALESAVEALRDKMLTVASAAEQTAARAAERQSTAQAPERRTAKRGTPTRAAGGVPPRTHASRMKRSG